MLLYLGEERLAALSRWLPCIVMSSDVFLCAGEQLLYFGRVCSASPALYHSWILNLFRGSIQNKIKSALNSKVCVHIGTLVCSEVYMHVRLMQYE